MLGRLVGLWTFLIAQWIERYNPMYVDMFIHAIRKLIKGILGQSKARIKAYLH